MESYNLRKPVLAVQYLRSINEAEVAELVKGNGSGSYSNMRGPLELTNLSGSAHRVLVEPGEWVVRIGDGFTILGDNEFRSLFVAE